MIFTPFSSDDIVTGRINQVSSGMFGTGSLTVAQSTFVTASSQANVLTGSNPYDVKNGQYYLDVYSGADQYFSIAYGDYYNSGSSQFDWTGNTTQVLTNETKIIYTQYKNTLLQPGDNLFSFASSSINTPIDSSAIFVVNFTADKFQDQVDPGQIQLNFSGANGQYSYIDDSQVINKQQNVYNLISGSIINGIPTPYTHGGTVTAYYQGTGLFYPTNGVVILNAVALDKIVGITDASPQITATGRPSNQTSTQFKSYWRDWIRKFFLSLRRSNKNMAVRKSEFVPSTNYFIRVKNKEFNYSNNPTFVSNGNDGKTQGTIIYPELISNPRTYVTTIGLYDSNNELLAVGKLSKPTQKSFDNELLIKCRIDF
jgi:hypothetical protein